MKRSLPLVTVIGLAGLLAACGSDNGGTATPSTAGAAAPVTAANIQGVGAVLTADGGHAVYASDEEASGKVLCVDGCTAFWKPVAAGAGTPAGGAMALGVISRPDGSKQLTAAGRPLYTFSQDSAGKVTGDGFTDDFGGQHFTWHVVHADGTTGATSGSPATTAGGSGGGYGGY